MVVCLNDTHLSLLAWPEHFRIVLRNVASRIESGQWTESTTIVRHFVLVGTGVSYGNFVRGACRGGSSARLDTPQHEPLASKAVCEPV
jgi:hypothetical protein